HAEAYTDFRHGPSAPEPGLREQLALPDGFNPRTLAWAAALRREPRYARAARARAGAAAAHPHGRLQLHAGAGRLRARRGRRVLARPARGLLRALRGR